MLIVGLTGGVASGKSVVSQVWKEEGACLIDADRIARELVQPRTPAWKALVKAFGKEILQKDGSIHRKKLANRVFSNPVERDLLNRILHPRIKREIARRIKRIGQKGPKAIVVIDAALLVETGYYRDVDEVVVVTSTKKQQMERLKRREQMDRETAQGIIDSQISGEERIRVADIIIRNEGSLKEIEKKAKGVLQKLKRMGLQKDSKLIAAQKNQEDSKERV
jgi:dephospho-CoA kinase